MNRTTEIRSSLVDSAANWDSMGKTKLLKLAEAAAASVPQTEWGMQMSALQGVVDNLVQDAANNQTKIIKGTNLGDEMDMAIALQTQHFPGLSKLRALIRGEFIVNGDTAYPLEETVVGIAIRTSHPVGSSNLWFKWEEFGGVNPSDYSVTTEWSDDTTAALATRDLTNFKFARLSFLCSFQLLGNSGLVLWPEFLTSETTEMEDMFLTSSYIQSTVQLDSIVV